MHINVVCFQVPYPPDSGGVVDVFYKLKALKNAGVKITLHTFYYGAAQPTDSLLDVADKVFYYPRKKGTRALFSLEPYIVVSRKNKDLLHRLCLNDDPVLFEGLHCCHFLNHPLLKNRTKLVRAHNIEHDYYLNLAKAAKNIKNKLFFILESIKLRRFEPILRQADGILALTEADATHFASHYPEVAVHTIPCFFNDEVKKNEESFDFPWGKQSYVLYHGNLAVEENQRAVTFILKEVSPLLENVRMVIAGKNPSQKLEKAAKKIPAVSLLANPTQKEMAWLISHAQIHLLPTFQSTGIKLKLIHALMNSPGSCVVNPPMITDEKLRPFCTVAETAEEMAEKIKELYTRPLSETNFLQRVSCLKTIYDNSVGAKKIVELLLQ